MVYRRRGGRRRVGRRGRRGGGGYGGGFGGGRGSCRILKRRISMAHGRRARGKALGMYAKVCGRGGRRRSGRRGRGGGGYF
jgi:hypothetical protein